MKVSWTEFMKLSDEEKKKITEITVTTSEEVDEFNRIILRNAVAIWEPGLGLMPGPFYTEPAGNSDADNGFLDLHQTVYKT